MRVFRRALWIVTCCFARQFNGCRSFESELTNLVKKANIKELACEGQSINLSCSPEEGIKVKSAFWGRNDVKTCPSEDPAKTHTVLCKPTDTAYPMKKLSAICDKKTLCVVNASEAFLEKTMCPKVVPESSVRLSCYERHGSQMRLLLVCLVGRILFCLDLSNHKMKIKK